MDQKSINEGISTILNHHGKEHQIKKLKEELAELLLALIREDRANTLEEYADVQVVMMQFDKILSEEERAKVAEIKMSKISRELKRIGKKTDNKLSFDYCCRCKYNNLREDPYCSNCDGKSNFISVVK